MALVYRTTKVQRTTFAKLPFGAEYWVSGSLATAPSVKLGRASKLGGWSTTTGAPTATAVTDTTVAVVKVPRQFSKSRAL